MADHAQIHDFLRQLEHDGIARVGVREHVAIEALLAVPRPPEDVPVAIAAVLGTSSEQVSAIQGAWAQWSTGVRRQEIIDGVRPLEPGEALPPPPSQPGSLGRRIAVGFLAAVGATLVGLAVVLGWPTPEEPEFLVYGPPAPPWEIEAEPPPADGPRLVEVTPESQRPITDGASRGLPGSETERAAVLGVSGLFTATGAVLLALFVGAQRQRRRIDEQAEADRATLTEGTWALPMLHQVDAVQPFPPATLEAIARELARASHALDGSEWDVPQTVDATARAGGQLQPRYAPRHQGVPLVVLIDAESKDHPFLHVYEALLDNWARLGLSFERWTFEGAPHRLRGDHGQERRFTALARARPDALVLVLTRLQNPFRGMAASSGSWVRWLDRWPGRAVMLDPDPRPLAERIVPGALPDGHAPYLPLTEAGLWTAARWFREGGTPSVAWPTWPPPSGSARVQAMRDWAALAQVVPRPRWAHLDDLRTAFFADALPHWHDVIGLLEHLGMPGSDHGPGLDTDAMGPAPLEALRSREGGEALERAVRLRLKHQLAARAKELAQQGHTFAARVAELKVAVHDCALGDRDPRDVVGEYLDQGVRPELERLMEEETGLAVSRFDEVQKKEVGALLGGRASLGQGVAGLGCVPVLVAAALGASAFGASAMWWAESTQEFTVAQTLVVPAEFEVALPEAPEPPPAPEPPSQPEPEPEPPTQPEPEPTPDDASAAPDAPIAASDAAVDLDAGGDANPTEGEAAPAFAPPAMVRLAGGVFTMGDDRSDDDERPAHRVQISAFDMCRTEVTQGLWEAVMNANPADCDYGCGPEHPVQDISWVDAARFMNALSRRMGLEECYRVSGGSVRWPQGLACTGYRMPTEAEWEYAARAGTDTQYSWGDRNGAADQYAWFSENSGATAHPVGGKKPNPLGLHDMHGNVWEWVWDAHASTGYPTSRTGGSPAAKGGSPDRIDPIVTDPEAPHRVLRGGSFNYSTDWLRSANRFSYLPSFSYGYYGVRCVRSPPAP